MVQPMPMPMGMAPQPIYLRVPPGHRKNWRKHCLRYGACGQPVYFVGDNWYNNVYVPSYRAHGNYQGEERGVMAEVVVVMARVMTGIKSL